MIVRRAASAARCAACCVAILLLSAPADAQQDRPLGPYVVDFRGVFARHKQEAVVATDLGVPATNLPTRSFGLSGGAHFYPWRTNRITLGIGAHVAFARGSRTLDTAGSATVQRHFKVFAPELSFNFGHRNGWSYISGGIGRSTLFVDRTDHPVSDAQGRRALHYGGGARWFTNHHVAVSFDFRWYSVAAQASSATGGVAQPRTTLLLLSGGIALR